MSSGFAGLLQAAAGPIAKRVLASLGIGVVSYAAINTALSAVQSAVGSAYGAITGEVAAVLSLAGFGQAVGIVLGAFVARLSYAQLNKLQVLAR